MLTDIVRESDVFYIYGAQVVAYGAYKALMELTRKSPECFLVTSAEGNPGEIEGIPVRTPEKAEIPTHSLIVVGVTELLQREIGGILNGRGFTNLFFLTQHEEYLLMGSYFSEIGRFPLVEEPSEKNGNPGLDFALYEVRNHRDKPLSKRPPLFPYEKSIQAGAALTDISVAPMGDDTGGNISAKNKQYCEMTATYWVWKNTDHEWKGIEHYRRHLLVTPAMIGGDADAILPLPYLCYPNTLSQFRRFVSQDVLDALLRTLMELHPRQYDEYLAIIRGHFQYTYNLVCAKREVFDDYCAWFFRITEAMERMGTEVPEIAETRALSYVAEVLTNIYFMSNSGRWRIRHAEKAIYA